MILSMFAKSSKGGCFFFLFFYNPLLDDSEYLVCVKVNLKVEF